MDMPQALLDRFPPSATALLDLAKTHVDDALLWVVANSDYGHRAEEAFVDLRVIRDRGIIPTPISFSLSEVLCLSRWHDPDTWNRPYDIANLSVTQGNFIRFFACAAILGAKADPLLEFPVDDFDADFALCLRSAGELGEEFNQAFASWLTWLLQKYEFPNVDNIRQQFLATPPDSRESKRKAIIEELQAATLGCDHPHLAALALLAISLRMNSPNMSELDLDAIAKWVLQIEQTQRDQSGPQAADDPEHAPFSVEQGRWTPMAVELRGRAKSIVNGAIRENIELCLFMIEL